MTMTNKNNDHFPVGKITTWTPDEHDESDRSAAIQETIKDLEKEADARGPKLVNIGCPRCGSNIVETRSDAFVCLDCDAYIGGPDGLEVRPRPVTTKSSHTHPSMLVHRKMFDQVKKDLEEAREFDYRKIPCRWCGQTGHVEVCLDCFEEERARIAAVVGKQTNKDEHGETTVQIDLTSEELSTILFALRTEKNFRERSLAMTNPGQDIYVEQATAKIVEYDKLINKLADLYGQVVVADENDNE